MKIEMSESHVIRNIKCYYMSLNRITINPEVMSGQPCIRGLRIPVPLILKLLASGKTIPQILKDYPELEEEDIRQALSFASWATSEKTIPVTAGSFLWTCHCPQRQSSF